MTTLDQYSPERLRDRAIIQDVLNRWCRAVDRLDLDRVQECFHPDAYDDHGPYKGSIGGLVAWIRERHRRIPFSVHSLSNVLIEFEDASHAVVESHVRAVQRYPAEAAKEMAQLSGDFSRKSDTGFDLVFLGRYVDRFELRDGTWRIAHRTTIYDSTMMFDAPPSAPGTAEVWQVGRRDEKDFVFGARARLG